jgi:L-ascorbate metabolism protein UlaG (beta-lactamase superfamily)
MADKVTWYGHACFLVQTGNTKILIDPFITGNPTSPVKAESVEADYILVSHGHGDHLGDAVGIAKRTGATVISNYEIHNWFIGQGVN